MRRRYGETAEVLYHDTASPEVRGSHAEMIGRIHEHELIYPVTVVDGQPVHDGAVSHAVILRAIQARLEEAAAAAD